MSNYSGESADLSAISTLIDALPPREPVALDPGNAAHRAAIEAALTAAGRTPDRYPALHAALDGACGEAEHVRLMDAGVDPSGLTTAMTWHASGPGHLLSGGTLFALDGDSGELLALGHNSNVGEGFVPISTRSAEAKQAGQSLKILAVNHSISETGAARFTALAWSGPIYSNGVTFYIQDPTLTPKHPPNVTIAVARTGAWINTDVDYWYGEPDNITNPYLIVPFVGRAILPYAVTGAAAQPIASAQLGTQIYFTSNGNTVVVPMSTTYTQNFRGKVTKNSSNPNEVDWAYEYLQGSSYTNTPSLVYNQQSLVNDGTSYFAYDFQIPVDNGPTPYFPFTVCSKNTPEPSSPQCNKILCNLTFTWHCLAAGTEVTLADGRKAAIESLDNSHRVRTGKGEEDLAVEATTLGTHSSDPDGSDGAAVYKLVTEAGHELIGTGRHLIQTPGGLVPLESLGAGAVVTTEEGSTAIASCDRIAFDGAMHNLKLGNEEDRNGGLSNDAVCTYVANGIVVGDHTAERMEQRRRARDLDYMQTRLPEALVTDYASAVEDILY